MWGTPGFSPGTRSYSVTILEKDNSAQIIYETSFLYLVFLYTAFETPSISLVSKGFTVLSNYLMIRQLRGVLL